VYRTHVIYVFFQAVWVLAGVFEAGHLKTINPKPQLVRLTEQFGCVGDCGFKIAIQAREHRFFGRSRYRLSNVERATILGAFPIGNVRVYQIRTALNYR